MVAVAKNVKKYYFLAATPNAHPILVPALGPKQPSPATDSVERDLEINGVDRTLADAIEHIQLQALTSSESVPLVGLVVISSTPGRFQ